jgi:hypothetical protein
VKPPANPRVGNKKPTVVLASGGFRFGFGLVERQELIPPVRATAQTTAKPRFIEQMLASVGLAGLRWLRFMTRAG